MLRCTVSSVIFLLTFAVFVRAQTAMPVAEPDANAPQPSAAEAYRNMPPTEAIADTLLARGRYLASIHVYEQLQPSVSILNKMGIACEHMMMWDRARAAFEAALKLNPKYAEAYNNLGTLSHGQGDLQRAEKMYRKSLKLQPGSANTLQNLGTLYYAEHKFKKGDEAYRRALAIDPQILDRSANHGIPANSKVQSASEVHYHLAATFALAGNQRAAMENLRKAVLEGFHDRGRLMRDKGFAELRTTDAFLHMVEDMQQN